MVTRASAAHAHHPAGASRSSLSLYLPLPLALSGRPRSGRWRAAGPAADSPDVHGPLSRAPPCPTLSCLAPRPLASRCASLVRPRRPTRVRGTARDHRRPDVCEGGSDPAAGRDVPPPHFNQGARQVGAALPLRRPRRHSPQGRRHQGEGRVARRKGLREALVRRTRASARFRVGGLMPGEQCARLARRDRTRAAGRSGWLTSPFPLPPSPFSPRLPGARALAQVRPQQDLPPRQPLGGVGPQQGLRRLQDFRHLPAGQLATPRAPHVTYYTRIMPPVHRHGATGFFATSVRCLGLLLRCAGVSKPASRMLLDRSIVAYSSSHGSVDLNAV